MPTQHPIFSMSQVLFGLILETKLYRLFVWKYFPIKNNHVEKKITRTALNNVINYFRPLENGHCRTDVAPDKYRNSVVTT